MKRVFTTLGNIDLGTEVFEAEGVRFALDEEATNHLGSYLGVNKVYLRKCPPELRNVNLGFWMDKHPEDPVVIFHHAGDVVGVRSATGEHIESVDIVKAAERVLHSESDVISAEYDGKTLEISILDPAINSTTEYGVVRAGVRIVATPLTNSSIYVDEIYQTNNGLFRVREDYYRVKMKGTKSEVLTVLEDILAQAIDRIDERIEEIPSLDTKALSSSLSNTLQEIAKHEGLSSRIRDYVLLEAERVAEANIDEETGEVTPATARDVLEVFAIASRGRVRRGTSRKLERIAGEIVTHPEQYTKTCRECEQLVDSKLVDVL